MKEIIRHQIFNKPNKNSKGIKPDGKNQTDSRNAIRDGGQAKKGAGRMPWHWEPMKDAISCEKPRGGANIL